MTETSSRLLELLSLLQGRRDWPGAELADRLEVSGRTIRRDVGRLRELGYPVESLTGPEAQIRIVVRARPGADAPDAARELRLRAHRALVESGTRTALSREIAITPLAAGVAA